MAIDRIVVTERTEDAPVKRIIRSIVEIETIPDLPPAGGGDLPGDPPPPPPPPDEGGEDPDLPPPVEEPPVPTDEARYPYFARLTAHPKLLRAHSLRSEESIAPLRESRGTSPWAYYDTEADACALVIPETIAGTPERPNRAINLPTQLFVPVDVSLTDAAQNIVLVADVLLPPNMTADGYTANYCKAWNICSPKTGICAELGLEMWKSGFAKPPAGELAWYSGRVYTTGGTTLGPNVTSKQPLGPRAEQTIASVWTRLFVRVEGADADGFNRLTWVVASSRHPAVTVYDRIQFTLRTAADGRPRVWGVFRFEFNTSRDYQDITAPIPEHLPFGPIITRQRNVVLLRDLTDEEFAALLEQPVA